MVKPKIILIGGGGHCKVIISLLKELNSFDIYGISDLKKEKNKEILGVKQNLLDLELPKLYKSGIKYAFLCLGNVTISQKRVEMYTMLKKIGFKIPKIISKNAVIAEDVKIGNGTVIMPGVIINSGTRIGQNCIINTGSTIDHDCIIGNNVHVAPGVNISGSVKIGDNTLIGIGTKIIQNIIVGKSTLVGAGSVIVKNIPDKVKVYGVPAKIVSKI